MASPYTPGLGAGRGPGASPASPAEGGGGPTSPMSVSDQGQQNPALKNAISQITGIANMVRQYAQAYPQCDPEARQIGELLQRCLMKTTQAQPGAEPAAPPV